MQTRQLGRTGLEVTQLGYGSMGLRGPNTWGVRVVDESSADRFLNRVLDSGINFIDTAPDYGTCEERIGKYISHRRDEFYLATKCGCDYIQHDDHIEIKHTWTAATVKRNLETSLQRMKTEYLDLLQFHGGTAVELQAAGLIDLLQEFRSQGIVRFIGISTKHPDIEDLIKLGVFDTFQVPYSCLSPENEASITSAAKSGAGVIIRGGIAYGGPDAEIQRPALNDVWDSADLAPLLEPGMKKAEMILRYTLSHPHCHTVIVGTCNDTHLDDNLTALEKGPLPAELINEIRQRVATALS